MNTFCVLWSWSHAKSALFAITMLVVVMIPKSGLAQSAAGTQVIIKLHNQAATAPACCIGNRIGNSGVDSVSIHFNAVQAQLLFAANHPLGPLYLIAFAQDAPTHVILEAYNALAQVEYAELDFIGTGGAMNVPPNDAFFTRQWGLHNDGSFANYSVAGAHINMLKAWDLEQGDSAIVVAVIDGGAKMDHPELLGRLWSNSLEIPGNGIDDDGNGYVDDVQGWNFVNNTNNPADDFGHGTNVAGIIGANANNGVGYVGVDWNCKLMILKALDHENLGTYVQWSSAIIYAVNNGAHVINLSLGGESESRTLQSAVQHALTHDVVVVASMMNTNSSTVYYPAAYEGVIAVGAVDSDDKRSVPFHWSTASGSCYGDHISVVAPGSYIYGLDYQSNTNYNGYWSGTSQAAPHVAGLAALLLAQNPLRTPAAIKQIIQDSAEDQVGDSREDTPGWDRYYGYGRVNAYNALLFEPPTGIVPFGVAHSPQIGGHKPNGVSVGGIVIRNQDGSMRPKSSPIDVLGRVY